MATLYSPLLTHYDAHLVYYGVLVLHYNVQLSHYCFVIQGCQKTCKLKKNMEFKK